METWGAYFWSPGNGVVECHETRASLFSCVLRNLEVGKQLFEYTRIYSTMTVYDGHVSNIYRPHERITFLRFVYDPRPVGWRRRKHKEGSCLSKNIEIIFFEKRSCLRFEFVVRGYVVPAKRHCSKYFGVATYIHSIVEMWVRIPENGSNVFAKCRRFCSARTST